MQLVVRTWFALGASESLAGLDTTHEGVRRGRRAGQYRDSPRRLSSEWSHFISMSRESRETGEGTRASTRRETREKAKASLGNFHLEETAEVGGLSHVFLSRIDSLPPAPESFVDSPCDDFRIFETTLNLSRIAYISEDTKVKTR
jgi:hypothetical protein